MLGIQVLLFQLGPTHLIVLFVAIESLQQGTVKRGKNGG